MNKCKIKTPNKFCPRMRVLLQTCSIDETPCLYPTINNISTGLCDSNGLPIFIGSKIKRTTEINRDVHGDFIIFEVKQKGMTPILSYFVSEKGQIFPVGESMSILIYEYNITALLFTEDLSTLKPTTDLTLIKEIIPIESTDKKSPRIKCIDL